MNIQKLSLVGLIGLCAFFGNAFGAGRSMIGTAQPASRAGIAPTTHTVASLKTPSAVPTENSNNDNSGTDASRREQEKIACLSNNVGVGNTFVWAAKNSNTLNYSSMVEDTENPDNNTCFVLVGMRSDDVRISTADIQPRYFEWGTTITCGDWVDESKMEERILEAKKKARTWGTIGGVVGGAGLGVGVMEAGGNKLLANKVDSLAGLQGQKQYEENSTAWYAAKAKALEQDNPDAYKEFKDAVEKLKTECQKDKKPEKCDDDRHKGLLDLELD